MNDNSQNRRNTKQRQTVLDTVMEHCDHPTAEEIYLDVRKKDSKISKGTVYRNLNILSENGDVNQVKVQGADRFDKTTCNHYHIICTKCKKVFDAPIEYAEQNDSIVEDKTGFIITKHQTMFEGICPKCQKEKE